MVKDRVVDQTGAYRQRLKISIAHSQIGDAINNSQHAGVKLIVPLNVASLQTS
jgi:hypothetical protein